MDRVFRYLINQVAILVMISACTDFQELTPPAGLSVGPKTLIYFNESESQSLSVRSGTTWYIYDMPEWINVQDINNRSYPFFEWEIVFVATTNEEYDREGTIIIRNSTETVEIPVSQAGKKGEYVAVDSVTLSPTELTLTEGESASLSITISPSNASEKTVSWSSSSPSVATVDTEGKVRALVAGTTIITVKTEDGSKTATCTVTVHKKSFPSQAYLWIRVPCP